MTATFLFVLSCLAFGALMAILLSWGLEDRRNYQEARREAERKDAELERWMHR